MIKLNNKNITYVALADSNNSVKAPKEIWYADSNNSVKLVYRRKDALIEGEDYEKYHWILTDTGSPHIQVAYNYNTDNGAYIETTYKCNYSNGGYDTVIGFSINQNNNIGIRIFNVDNKTYVDHHKTVNGVLSSSRIMKLQSNIDAERYIKATLNNVIIDDTEYPSINWGSGFDAVDRRGTILCTNQGNNDVHYAETKIRVNNAVHDFIPCKLLKPVPKWLDANGIRRQVGECGMIDLVSGKFYGNVNNAGTFTVENYYERKEWLVGDGSAYIDTGHNVNEDLDYETKAHLLPNTYLFWYRSGSPYKDQTMVARSATSAITGIRVGKNSNSLDINDFADAEVKWNDNKVSINGINYTSMYKAITFSHELYLFNTYLADVPDISSLGYTSNSVKCSYFRFLDSNRNYIQNLIPCTLTMDLPASMDANNIARTKGTSGMWDLVSDRFYGNVAQSGTFKAVNLAEGVDYERHKWLVGDWSTYIEGINYNLWDNTISLQIGKTNVRGNRYLTCSYLSITEDTSSSPSYLMVIFRQNNDSIPHIADIAPYSSMPDVVTMDFYIKNSLFYCNQNGVVKTNNPAQTAIESTWKSITPRIYSAKISYIRELLPNNTYSSNLIPVKLLKSIPSKYDANGIARQAGECGMYDTVNDVFYGNVASSGSFTVEDDN